MLRSFFNFRKVLKKESQTTIKLTWKTHHFWLSFSEFAHGLDEALVKDLKEKCKEKTKVPIATMKLSVSGAKIKDDTATLASCGIHPGCEVILEGDTVNEADLQQVASGSDEEIALLSRVNDISDQLNGLVKDIEEFEAAVAQPKVPVDKKYLEDTGIRLSELLMQALMKLDAVECPPEFTTARARRRENVKLSQSLMQRVDDAKVIAKKLCK
ncbi:uncharacterized protein BYT42DRAFT_281703 [Radiomyces spectabilis]|uniref:uncharacterized protein n=1 Tax=Radiomyces spectabilis TaxID=64574 RepID=UPI002220266E|nr:uncharacterized protein BYT42DRAFT_281703 [Radiomyces spectabilis]KAI8384976.1 hypothetical protein BYT42DRAFT_281703 [Radiomyces spectabilis]